MTDYALIGQEIQDAKFFSLIDLLPAGKGAEGLGHGLGKIGDKLGSALESTGEWLGRNSSRISDWAFGSTTRTENDLYINGKFSHNKYLHDSINAKHRYIDIDDLSNVKVNGTSAIRIKKGTNGKIAIIGGGMAGKGGVFDYSNYLRNKGYTTHLFAGNEISSESRKIFSTLSEKFGGEDRFQPSYMVKNYRFLGSRPLFENKRWANKIVDEGYTIIDIGDPFNKGFSIFYATEKKTIFGVDYGKENIR